MPLRDIGPSLWRLFRHRPILSMFRPILLALSLLLSPLAAGQTFDRILDAHFDDKPLGLPIGSGGPALGEPLSWDNGRKATEIVPAVPGRALRLTRLNTPSSTAATSMRFGFLDNREINSGVVRISLQLTPQQIGAYAVRTREAGGSTQRWIDIEFLSDGSIRRQVRNGVSTSVASYVAGQSTELVMLGDFTAGSYSISINGKVVDSGTFDPAERGVGSMLLSFLSGSDNFDKSMVIDDLLVEVPSERIFNDRFQ